MTSEERLGREARVRPVVGVSAATRQKGRDR